MRRFYIFSAVLLSALLSTCFATAALTTTIKWNIPESLQIYVGGSGESYRVDLPSGATEYVATINNSWGSAYLAKVPGYEFESVIADGTALSPMYNGMFNLDMSRYDGKIVEVTMEPLEYDSQLTVNVINGRDALSATMWGTGRKISFDTGNQLIAYSSKYEKGIDIQAPLEGSENPYIKQNGVDMEWKTYYSWDNYLYHKDPATGNNGFNFDNGTDFEIKYCETADIDPVQPCTILIEYLNEDARSSLNFIFNITKMETIEERESFTVKEGEQIRLVFNTKDYDISIDGTNLEPVGETTAWIFTAEGDKTIALSAGPRSYDTITLTLALTDPEMVVLRKGELNGEIVTTDQLEEIGTKTYTYLDANETRRSAELTIYKTDVSQKSPKIFISEAEGHWLAACEYSENGEVIQAAIASPDYELNVVAKEIIADTPLVIFVSVDDVNAKVEDLIVRDRNRNTFSLETGYNDLVIDTEYSSPLSISSYGMEANSAFAAYCNMTAATKDSESGAFNFAIDGETVIHIFAGRPVPAKYTISAEISPEAENAEVLVDHIIKLSDDRNYCTTFKNCEVKVSPAGHQYLLDDEIPVYEGNTHIFKVTGNHHVFIGSSSGIEASADPCQTHENSFSTIFDLHGRRQSAVRGQILLMDGKKIILR